MCPTMDLQVPITFVTNSRRINYPVPGDPIYGDMVLLSKPDGGIIHSAIYWRTTLFSQKNGDTVMYPGCSRP